MRSEHTIQRHSRRLRRYGISGTDDVLLKRVSQAIEYGIRWAREDTRGWPLPIDEAGAMTALIKKDLGLAP